MPDFLVEYEDGRKALIEVKDPSRLDSDDVQRKRKAVEMWCKTLLSKIRLFWTAVSQ
ncbi:MAG: hypothetical protein KJ964_02715 [Verrucomicrobia bacterium]|nr:hypothetical protein [Verrucomicrobiota bacterium]